MTTFISMLRGINVSGKVSRISAAIERGVQFRRGAVRASGPPLNKSLPQSGGASLALSRLKKALDLLADRAEGAGCIRPTYRHALGDPLHDAALVLGRCFEHPAGRLGYAR